MSRISPYVFTIFTSLLFCICCLCACGDGNNYPIVLELVQPIDQDPFQQLKTLDFTIVNASDSEKQRYYSYEPAEGFTGFSVSLDNMEYYPDFYVRAEGLDPEGKLYARGGTGILSTQAVSGSNVAIYFARAGSISMPPAQLLHERAGVRLASPNDFDVLIVGGARRDKDGSWGDSHGQIELFAPLGHRTDVLRDGEDVYYMDQGLVGHSATPLDGSSVLVAGGYGISGDKVRWQDKPVVISSATVNLATEVTLKDSFQPRSGHRSSYLMDEERVLVCGGLDTDSEGLADCSSVSASSFDLTHAFNMKTARSDHSQTVVLNDDGSLRGLLFYGGSKNREKAAEWLAAGENGSRQVESPGEIRQGHAAELLNDGRVLIVGGRLDEEVTGSGLLFDPGCLDTEGCKIFKALSDLLEVPRHSHTLTPVSDSKLVACGGFGADGTALGDCEILKVVNGSVTRTGAVDMVHRRGLHDAVFLPDNTVMIVGGFNEEEGALDAVEIFVPSKL